MEGEDLGLIPGGHTYVLHYLLAAISLAFLMPVFLSKLLTYVRNLLCHLSIPLVYVQVVQS